MRKVNVALVGYGTIGTGVVEVLKDNRQLITGRTGVELDITYIVDKDITTPRRVDWPGAKKTTDYKEALNDPSVDIVIELAGGTGFAYTLVEESLKAGKNVVTANKALLAEKGTPLFKLAADNKRALGFEASVCGGIPIIRTIADALAGDNVESLYGIVNGTTNFILTKMREESMDFDTALKMAQKLGFAEADPTLDIGGHDAAHKAAILAALAFNTTVDYNAVHTEGITTVELEDVKNAQELGYIVKLLAVAKLDADKQVEVRVNPTLVPFANQLASVRNEFNAVLLQNAFLGQSMYYGRGAGSRPTATAVVADLIDIARVIETPAQTTKFKAFNTYKIKPMGDIESRYYLRFHVLDKPGALSKIAGIFAAHHISIASVLQKERSETDYVPLILTTHAAKEKNVLAAMGEIEKLDFSKDRGRLIRIME